MFWSIVGKLADLGPGTLREVQLEGRTYAIANVDGTLFAIDCICGHAGGHLGLGKLIGATVKCPVHGSFYDLKTGKNLKKPFIPLAKAADRQVSPSRLMERTWSWTFERHFFWPDPIFWRRPLRSTVMLVCSDDILILSILDEQVLQVGNVEEVPLIQTILINIGSSKYHWCSSE